jgi:Stabilization of polarity axis
MQNFAKGFDDSLLSVAIIERDTTEDVQMTWSYPSLDGELLAASLRHCGLASKKIELQFTYNNFNNVWLHIFSRFPSGQKTQKSQENEPDGDGNGDNDNNNNEDGVVSPLSGNVRAFSVVLATDQFNPEKYASLCKLFANIYNESGSTAKVLDAYLSVFRRGKYDTHFDEANFDPRRALLVTSVKDVTRLFGAPVILLWTALMMKKRVAVYSDRLTTLLRLIRGFPVFVWHRQDWRVLRPHVDLASDGEIESLHAAGNYCAGFTDPAVKARSDLWDVLVDVNAREIRVAGHAQQDFELAAFQRNLAKLLVDAAEDANVSGQQFIKLVATKTKELLDKLNSLRQPHEDGESYITMEALHQVKLPPGMDHFLFAIAAAEGLVARHRSTSSSVSASSSQVEEQEEVEGGAEE